ncbi:MAG: 4-alpha-glucanotransferase [Lachnospiraceae bacterium]|nr:4-alpha-glucanotransferase [Lachnospiraceae bacterium]
MNTVQTSKDTELTEKKKQVRVSGILVHPTSFPSPYGIGDMGPGAYDFIDFLKKSGQHLWQVLPLGPTGFGDSPYQGFSAFAGQPLIISPDKLVELKLLTQEDVAHIPDWDDTKVDYGSVITYKTGLLKKAWTAFFHTPDKTLLEEFELFCEEEKDWLDDYALFMACKDYHEGRCWLDWEEDILNPTETSKKLWRQKLSQQIHYYCFVQFIFQKQWIELRDYAHENEVEIIGDIPIFVALDSADVWSGKKLFQLDSKGHPTSIAGVPPDYFSATGQLWGNPLYDWDYHKETSYAWWIRRIKRQLALTDYLRIDHFRGFEAYWSVPAGEETAINGKWVKGPCEDLFKAIQKELGDDLPIFAEDLGVITPEVEHLRDEFGFPGMKVLQFGFGDMNDTNYVPHFYTTTNCICYTGTHDNDTTMGWYAVQPEIVRDRIRRYGNTDGNCVSLDFIRFCMGSIAKYAIFPIQDLLILGSDARMNTPGVAAANWAFRYRKEALSEERCEWLLRTTQLYNR